MILKFTHKLLRWYDQYDDLNIIFVAFLFSIQVVHLLWLTTNVVVPRIFDLPPLTISRLFNTMIAVVDYTEIPAIIATSLVYVRSYKRGSNKKDIFYLLFLNMQWLHIFWITDEIVARSFFNYGGIINEWNSIAIWSAIVIDYLELPVIFETLKRAARILNKV